MIWINLTRAITRGKMVEIPVRKVTSTRTVIITSLQWKIWGLGVGIWIDRRKSIKIWRYRLGIV